MTYTYDKVFKFEYMSFEMIYMNRSVKFGDFLAYSLLVVYIIKGHVALIPLYCIFVNDL